MSQTRRTFLERSSKAFALGVVGSRIFPVRWTESQTADEMLVEYAGYDEADLLALAHRAVDTAKSAGAKYADVRINIARRLNFAAIDGRIEDTQLTSEATVGVRAVVDSTWGFCGGAIITPDGIDKVARLAVSRSRAAQPRNPHPFELAPTPVIKNGRWQTPIKIDPFSVSVGEHERVYREAMAEAMKVKGLRVLVASNTWFRWDQYFFSSEGSQTVQRIYTSAPDGRATSSPPGDDQYWVQLVIPRLRTSVGGFGYEVIADIDLKSEWRAIAEESVRLANLPIKSVDVGRYDVVLSPQTVAFVTHQTIGKALELDRALGLRANTVGTSYAAPPLDMIDKYRIGSPVVTITADRSRAHGNATVGWDEEGVQPKDITLVKEGVISDYMTTRDTAPALASMYKNRGQEVHSNGCAVRTGLEQPVLQCPNLAIVPSAGDASAEDLIKDIKHGLYVTQGAAVSDQQCLNTQVTTGVVFEINNGKLGGLVRDCALQFSSPQFWKNVDAVGGASSASLEWQLIDSPILTRLFTINVHAVPVRARQINAINTSKKA